MGVTDEKLKEAHKKTLAELEALRASLENNNA
jgi:hypothetical protein